jgi:hypothetical protein
MGLTRFIDLSGRAFGKLTAIVPVGLNKSRQYVWWCHCECGGNSIANGSNLLRGNTLACGCVRQVDLADRTRKHGMSKTRMFKIWTGVTKRCTNENCSSYNRYGGRGIEMCDRWKESFENFYGDMKDGYADNLTLEREDPNGNYCKDNCKWATMIEQARNKTNSVFIEYNGQKKSMAEWAELKGVPSGTIGNRIRAGWSVERSFTPTGRNSSTSSISKYLVH